MKRFLEKMAEIASLDVAVAQRFISSLSKSLQALCHGCMDFDSGIEIMGYINVNIDSGSKIDYVLNERVQKSRDNSMTFVSNSFVAKKDKASQLRDGTCSPIPELEHQYSWSSQKSSHHYMGGRQMSFSQSQVLRGSQKRAWGGKGRDWKSSPRKYPRHSNLNQNPYYPHPSPQTVQGASLSTFSHSDASHPENDKINIKTEALEVDNDIRSEDANTSNSHTENVQNSQNMSSEATDNVKVDYDAVSTNVNQEENNSENQEVTFFPTSESSEMPSTSKPYSEPSFKVQSTDSVNPTYDGSEYDPNDSNSNVPISFGDVAGVDTYSQRQSYSERAETSGEGASFECIEIDDDEEEEFQAMFGVGDNRHTLMAKWRLPDKEATSSPVGLNSFVCNLCGKTYARKEHLNRHFNMHLPESQRKVYKCVIPGCQQQYFRSDLLSRHMLVSHGIHKSRPLKQE